MQDVPKVSSNQFACKVKAGIMGDEATHRALLHITKLHGDQDQRSQCIHAGV